MGKREENAKRKLKLKALFEKIDNGKNRYKSHFLHRREARIRFGMFCRGYSQKTVAKWLKISESYVARLINGERYSKAFEKWLKDFLDFDYRFI